MFGSRSIYYRAKRGFDPVPMDIAVVVQAQIESVVSGVMFTVTRPPKREVSWSSKARSD